MKIIIFYSDFFFHEYILRYDACPKVYRDTKLIAFYVFY